jgi:hypothetical protein
MNETNAWKALDQEALMPKVLSVEVVDVPEGVNVFDVQVDLDSSFIVGDCVLHNSAVCFSRNLRLWDLSGRPVGHSLPFRQVPLHFRCRSHIVSVLHPYSDLPPRLQRRIREENFDGKAARETDLSTWLRRRGMTRNDDPIDFDDARGALGL